MALNGARPVGSTEAPVLTDPDVVPTLVADEEKPDDAKIVVDSVSRWYGNVVAVNDISFRLGAGITGLLGPNGAGKSTLLHMLAGLLKPSSGTVSALGQPVWNHPDIYKVVGLVPERETVYTFLSGWDFVYMSARLHGLKDAEAATKRAIDDVDMWDAKDRLTGGYSKGMKQRIKIAAAIVHRPPIVLLDEPFNGADPRQRLRMMDTFREMAAAGTTVVFSSHILEEVERLADNVLVIVAGRLAAAGEFHEIRRLMTDRPHTITLRTSDNRFLATALVERDLVTGIEFMDDRLSVRVHDLMGFASLIPRVSQEMGVSLYEVFPTDESLESVFSYLVRR